MFVDSLSVEFPVFLFAFAEEFCILGYRQGLTDVEQGMKMAAEENINLSAKGVSVSVESGEVDLTGGEDE